jgi:2-oxoglutarate dehydrogenase E2 component (dihydrolipoamide succinyltransferase)
MEPNDAGAIDPAAPPAAVEPAASEAAQAADLSLADTAPDAADAADAADAVDALSPAVRRLVRQYDLDITGIHGTGPAGRIRVGDVIGLLGGRGESLDRAGDAGDPARTTPADDSTEPEPAEAPTERRHATASPATPAAIVGTVFECDLGRVLAHRQRAREGDTEPLLTSYFLVAYADALTQAPELAAAGRFGVELTLPDGSVRRSLIAAGDLPLEAPPAERLRALDGQLRVNSGDDLSPSDVIVHNYGASGSLLATPLPVAAGRTASLGIGRLRREIVVRGDEETPRLATLCYLSLSFDSKRLTLERAHRFLAHAVRTLELWPE